MPKISLRFIYQKSVVLFILIFLVGCNFPPKTMSSNGASLTPAAELQQTEITFSVSIPQPLPAGDSIYLNLLDEVTGLSFNLHKYILQADNALSYSVTLPFTIGKVLKYRYSREGASIVNEHLYNDRPVRYRLYDVEGPAEVQDVISRWTDTAYQGPTGRIMGDVTDESSGKAVPNLLVTAGGEQTYTLTDGTFLLEGLPLGTHNLVFYAMDGGYHIYQQGAVVAADSTTPVSVRLRSSNLVTVIFTVTVPANTPPDAPLRLAGSLYQLGNTYADLSGGVSTLASRMPSLGKLADGRYILTLNLPAGTYFEYKYTLGDGLWSSEVTAAGAARLRQMLIPNSTLEQNDVIESWLAPETQPLHFEVKVPADTPSNESVSIQFNPGFGWLEPLPMTPAANPAGPTTWHFDLTGPFNHLTSLQYRYCRQEQCGAADDSAIIGVDPSGRVVNPASNPGNITDEVTSWTWMSNPDEAANIQEVEISPRSEGFIAGIAFQPAYHPSWGPFLAEDVNQVKSLNTNWLILSPTWTFTNNTPPILEPLASQDMPMPEMVDIIKDTSRTPPFTIGLYPQPNFPIAVDQWWQQARRDFPWWVSFFERYSNFILNFATITSYNGEPLILGGDWLNPALPGGTLSDGSPSAVPEDSEARWRSLIEQVRTRYSGAIGWMLTYPDGLKNPPPFLDAVDQVFILWSAPLAAQPGASVDEMQVQAGNILDQEILPFQQAIGKPVIIAIDYPSIDQAATGCLATTEGCLSYDLLAQPNPDIPELNLNLQAQANAYYAVLSAINTRDWVSGYVAMGYYPPAVLQDKSTSIHGKPASGVVWYWSGKYLGR